MSDFGVIIKFSKSQGGLNQSDIDSIEFELKEVVTTSNSYPSNIVRGNYLPLRKWDEDSFVSVISEYYLDENEQELKQWAVEEELEWAKEIIEKLKLVLTNINMSGSFEEW